VGEVCRVGSGSLPVCITEVDESCCLWIITHANQGQPLGSFQPASFIRVVSIRELAFLFWDGVMCISRQSCTNVAFVVLSRTSMQRLSPGMSMWFPCYGQLNAWQAASANKLCYVSGRELRSNMAKTEITPDQLALSCNVGYLYHRATQTFLTPSRCVGSKLVIKLQGPREARTVII